MAFIEPQAKILFLKNTGLTPAQCHTYRFKTAPEQRDFFKSLSFAERDAQSYQRVNSGVLEVSGNAYNFYSCDYIMFNEGEVIGSEAQSTRWYYAFVTKVEYIDNDNVRIYYQLDNVQTWMIPALRGLNYCYVIREHSADDKLFANTQAEDVDIGHEYQHESAGWQNILGKPIYNPAAGNGANLHGAYANWRPCIAKPFPDDVEANVFNRAGIPTPINVDNYQYFTSDVSSSNNAFRNAIRNMDENEKLEIVDMFMYPTALISDTYDGKIITEKVKIAGRNLNPWNVNDVGGSTEYIPHNNKLYTYPYCFVTVTNNMGTVKEFKFEYFNRHDSEPFGIFDISGTYAPNPEFYCSCRWYNNTEGHSAANTLTLTGVPKIPWVTDSYKVYQAQNASSIKTDNALATFNLVGGFLKSWVTSPLGILGGIASMMSAAESGGDGGKMGGMVGGASQVTGSLFNAVDNVMNPLQNIMRLKAKYADARKMTDEGHGTTNSGAMYFLGLFGFSAYYTKIPIEYARRIDRFWDMFGYAVNQVKKIDIFSRPYWNYVQAINVSITEELTPQGRMDWINALQNGITFWKPGVKIGSYNLDNRVG